MPQRNGQGSRGLEPGLQEQQRLLYVIALMWLAFWGIDSLSLLRPTWDTLVLRALWAVLTAGLGLGLGYAPASWHMPMRVLAGVVLPNIFLAWVAHRLGGSTSPVFGWLCVSPAVALMAGGGGAQGLMSTGLMTVSVCTVLTLEGAPPERYLSWLSMMLLEAAGVQFALLSQRQLLERLKAEAERKLAQRELQESHERALRAERMAQLGRLIAGVAHEVKNPLASVQANLRFLLEENPLPTSPGDSEYTEALEETMQGVEHIHQIVKDLSGMSRNEGAEAAGRCALAPVVDTSVRLASVRLKTLARLAVEMPDAVVARAEPRRLGQVLLNLLLNAADAIEDARVLNGQVALRVEDVGARVRLLVEDNGPGIPKEHLSHLFTTFFTTKEPGKGTGLGLALSRQYVESFGGTLRAENRTEGGARFIVDLPAA